MADIKVRIEVNPNAESEVIGYIKNDNAEISNVSLKLDNSNNFENIPTTENNGINGLSFAQDLVFNEQDYVDNADLQGGVVESEQNPTEFVWGVVPSSKEYSVKITFTNAINLKDIVVYGNQVANQFPTRAIIDGSTEIFNNDYKWAINLQIESDTHTIEFTHWNRVNYNACLTLICIMMNYFEIDKTTGLKSAESLSQSTGQPKNILYGIVPSSGSIETNDIEGKISEIVKNGIIPTSNVKIDIILNGNQVQSHTSTDSDYNINSRNFKIQMSDKLELFNNITYNGRDLTQPIDAYSLLLEILLPLNYSKENKNLIIDDNIKSHMSSIIIAYPYLEISTYREVLDKICTLCQLNIFMDARGNLKIINSRPTIKDNEISNVIKIQKRNQTSQLDGSIILKNKYNFVDLINYTAYKDYGYNALLKSINVTSFDEILGEMTLIDNNTSNVSDKARMDTYYTTGAFDVPKYSDYKLKIVLKVNNNEYTNGYVDKYLSPYGYLKNYTKYEELINDLNTPLSIDSLLEISSSIGLEEQTGKNNLYNIKNTWENQYPYYTEYDKDHKQIKFKMATSITTQQDKTSFEVVDNGNYYTINYKILTGLFVAGISAPGSDSIGDVYNYWSKRTTSNFEISIYGDIEETKFSEYSDNSNQKGKDIVSASIPSNNLIETNTKIDGQPIYEYIKQNILSDYSNGISTMKLSTNCTDYYNINGEKVKNWINGEIFEVGDFVRIDKDNYGNSEMKYADGSDMYFRVIGRTFRYAGVPLVDLELQEVKVID